MYKNAMLPSLLAFAVLALPGCGAENSMETDHYKVTFLNMEKVQPASRTEQADFQFTIEGRGDTKAPPDTVHVRFDNLDMDHGKNEVEAKKDDNGVYEAKTTLPMGGKWQAVVKIGDENAPFKFQAEGDAMGH